MRLRSGGGKRSTPSLKWTKTRPLSELKKNSVVHGLDRLRLGFDVEEVVAGYNALRRVIRAK